ncbi:hypothetical protein BASA81_002089 [Batrachochytrium salamandrivorans]|nr:hypothetical protein BASA81_002089 [Batrachochytrium salamandrivorans]
MDMSFNVLHWNLLAGYLGRNTNPWFLHGIALQPSQRKAIFQNYYARDMQTNKLMNPGWPKYVQDVLSPEQIQTIQDQDRTLFAWPTRFAKIKRILAQPKHQAEVISLVELDCFEEMRDFLQQFGYVGEFSRRPRPVSKDGCGLFWKQSEFTLMRKSRITYRDRSTPKQDRCALLVLLRHTRSQQPFLFASTHLARDVFGEPPKDNERARQLGELCQHIRDFTLGEEEKEDIACVVCGDVNSNSLDRLAGLCQVSTLLSSSKLRLHPFIFNSQAVHVPGQLTTLTESRRARIDAILFSAHLLQSQTVKFDDEIEFAKQTIAPNLIIPSDHFPLLTKMELIPRTNRVENAVKKWWSAVFKSKHAEALSDWEAETYLDFFELDLAFQHICAFPGGTYIDLDDAIASLARLGKRGDTNSILASLFTRPIDFTEFCALYFLAHPICERCAEFAFDYMDTSPRNGYINFEEMHEFVLKYERSAVEGDAAELFRDAEKRGLVEHGLGLSRKQFKTLLAVRYVEKMFQDTELTRRIVNKMMIPTLQYWNLRGGKL